MGGEMLTAADVQAIGVFKETACWLFSLTVTSPQC